MHFKIFIYLFIICLSIYIIAKHFYDKIENLIKTQEYIKHRAKLFDFYYTIFMDNQRNLVINPEKQWEISYIYDKLNEDVVLTLETKNLLVDELKNIINNPKDYYIDVKRK